MIWAAIILSAGVLLAALGILLHKKLSRSWMLSLLAAGLLLAACGGWLTYGQWSQVQERRATVYLGLRYLERCESDSASFYLKKADSDDDYVTAAARCLLERVRGNNLISRLHLDVAQSAAKTSEESAFLTTLRSLDVSRDDQLSLVVERLAGFLKLSAKRRAALDLYVQAESGGGDFDPQSAALDEVAYSRLQISSMLQSGAYESAVSTAAQLADRRPSAENRLLLAEAVAESAYNGAILSSGAFLSHSGEGSPQEDQSVLKERQSLEDQCVQLNSQLLELDIAISGAADQDALKSLNEQKLELTQRVQALRTRSDKLYVYRAFSAIADLRSLEAELVRARLHFALLDYEQAVDTLLDAADSLSARLSADHRQLSNSLHIVAQAYADGSAFHESQEFQDAVTQLLSAPFSDLMRLSQTSLTRDFVQRIVSDQKTYGQDLFLSSLDVRDYPVLRVTLSGREELLRQVVEHQQVTARDTHREIQYTARLEEGALSNICVVVDRSGSMDGAPMQNLKSALDEFVRNMGADTTVSLVAFDNSAQTLTGLTQDQPLLLTTVGGLSAGGGTEITSGIQAGAEVLSAAAGGRIMLLMTDGQSDVDFSVVDEASAAGITIHTIGFGSVQDDLLEQIAQRTGGQYIKADSSSELSNVYASLQQVIGNVVTLEYTVSNPEVVQDRYVFLRVEDSSVRRDYDPSPQPDQTRLYACSPALVSPDELQRMAQWGSSLSLTLTGEGLLDVESVTVGGQRAEITRQEREYLTLSLPPALSQGWQTLSLTLGSGAQLGYDRLLLVGSPQYYRGLRLGSLTIPSAQGVLPGDGTLVLAGEGIPLRENVSPDGSSLSLSVQGTLILPWRELPPDGEGPSGTDDLDLGDSGVISGWGVVTLDRGDGAYASQAPDIVARGALTLECEPGQSRLIQRMEGGN